MKMSCLEFKTKKKNEKPKKIVVLSSRPKKKNEKTKKNENELS